jgi:hypothetical protein
MATFHSVPLDRFPSDWKKENYSDTTFLSLIEEYSISHPLTDTEIKDIKKVKSWSHGKCPDAFLSHYNSEVIGNFLFIITNKKSFPKSAGEICNKLSFPMIENFCHNTGEIRAQIANLRCHADHEQKRLDSLL